MKNTKNIIIIVLAVIVIGGGILLYLHKKSVSSTPVETTDISGTTDSSSLGTSTPSTTTTVSPVVTVNSSWKNFAELQYNYEFKYPVDWAVSVQYVHPADNVPEQIVLTKGGYVISFFVNKTAGTPEAVSAADTLAIGAANGQTLYRYKNPMFDAAGQNGFFTVLVKNPGQVTYSHDIKYGTYFYSIYYHLPSKNTAADSIDQQVIAEADKIVSTFKFK